MVNFNLEEDQSLFTLYCAACAPLMSDSMKLDSDFDDEVKPPISNIISEMEFLEKYMNLGFKAFRGVYKQQRCFCDEYSLTKNAEMTVALSAAAAFTKRLNIVASKISQMCSVLADQCSIDNVHVAQQLENRIRDGDRPLNPSCISVLDFSSDTLSNWCFLDNLLKNRVGFKTTTAVISEGKVEEQALKDIKVSRPQIIFYTNILDVPRRRQRNPTGFHKFNFKDLKKDESELEDLEEPSSKVTAALSTDGGSTRGSTSGVYPYVDTLTSRSASSVHDDEGSIDTYEHRNSSVSFYNPKEERQIIQDEIADNTWEQEQRHYKRYFRIRNRVPTGHPSLMRGASDDLAEIVDRYTKVLEDTALDPAAKDNAKANRYILPNT